MSSISAIGPQTQSTNLAAALLQAKAQQGQNQAPLKCQIEVTNMPPKGGVGKAWASTFIPGMGQFLDGRNKAGAGFLAGELLSLGAAGGFSLLATKSNPIIGGIGTAISGVTFLTLKFMDIVNAYKGTQTK